MSIAHDVSNIGSHVSLFSAETYRRLGELRDPRFAPAFRELPVHTVPRAFDTIVVRAHQHPARTRLGIRKRDTATLAPTRPPHRTASRSTIPSRTRWHHHAAHNSVPARARNSRPRSAQAGVELTKTDDGMEDEAEGFVSGKRDVGRAGCAW